MENVNLTPKDIVNKHFKQKMRGYDSIEVDEFLDDVIQKKINVYKWKMIVY